VHTPTDDPSTENVTGLVDAPPVAVTT